MNLLLVEPADFAAQHRARIRGRRREHVVDVLRARVGSELRVGLLNGRVGKGVILAIDADAFEIETRFDRDPPPALPLRLVLALPRPKFLRRIFHACSAFGVKDLTLIGTRRVEKSFWGTPVLSPSAIRRALLLGLEQAGDTILPQVRLRKRFRPFVEDELADWCTSADMALAAHPPAPRPCPRAVKGSVVLAIGPEGGFLPLEIEMLQTAGCSAVSFGPRILTVEQAVPAALARIF